MYYLILITALIENDDDYDDDYILYLCILLFIFLL